MENNTKQNAEDNTIAILAYITIIGWIIALVMNNDKKSDLGGFHIRESLGIMLVSFAVMIVAFIFAFIPFLGSLITVILWLAIMAMWIMGLINAINKEKKTLPVIGDFFQKTFASIGK